MNSYSLTRIIKSLREGKKGHFKVICQTKTREYEFNIFNKVELIVKDLNDLSSSVLKEYRDDSFNIPDEDYTIKSITETIYTNRNEKYSETTLYCLDSVQIYLPVFRVLGEQVVFLLKYRGGIKRMFFVNGRVFYCDETEDEINVHQTDLRRVFDSFNGEIILFDRLPKKYSYGSINNYFSNYAEKKGKTYNVIKKGVMVNADIKG